MIEVSLTEARTRLPELLTRAAEGEDIYITRHGRPAGVLVAHDRWVKTRRHDILLMGREIGRRIEEARDRPLPDLPLDSDYDWQEHLAEIQRGRDKDPWAGSE